MTAFFKTILEMSATAAVVILVVLVIRLLLKRAPRKYSYALWAAAAFRLVCPVSFRSVFSIFALTDRVKLPGAGQTVTPPVTTIPPDAAVTMPPAAITQPPAVVTTPPAISVTPPAAAEPVTSVVSFWDVAAAIWLIVLAGLLIYGVVSYVRLRRRMANAVLLEGNVYQSDRVCSPFILGFVRPRIYLPFGLTEEQQAYVLAHEGHHLRRLDHIVRPVAFLILAVHWFNPLVWAAYYLMGRDMEMSCDEKVLGGAENIRKAYSMTLLSFAANRRFPSPGPLAFGETGVKGRIKNVLNWKKPALWVTIIAVIVVIAVILVCAANPTSTPYQWASDLSAADVDSGRVYTPEKDPQSMALSQRELEELVALLHEVPRQDFQKTPKRATWDFPTERAVTLTCGGADYVLNYGNGLMTLSCTDDSVNWRGRTHWYLKNDRIKDFMKGLTLQEANTYTYVTVKCVYQLPSISAIYPDDSGKIYLIGENKAAILDKEGRDEGSYFSDLPPWQELTAEEWKKLFWAGFEPDISGYQEPRIRWLSESFALADLDGTLWILLRPELESGLSDTVFFAYELAPVLEGEPAPAGWYRSVECVFMNGLSSWIPMNGNSGYTYGIEGDTLTLVHNGSLPTLGDSTGHTYHHAAEGGWQVLTEEKWGEMTDDTLILSGSTLWETIGKYEKRYIRRYENRYFLLSLDGEVWLGRDSMHPNGQRYIWDLYRLTPADDPAITVENKLSLSADLNRSGGADLITVSYDHVNETYRLQISESYGMATLLEWEFHRMDIANGGYYLYTREGKDYLLWWAPYSEQGVWHLRYEVISFDEKGGHVVLAQGERKYDASHIGMEHLTADLDDLRSFEREVNALLANSVPLLVNRTAEGGGILIGGQGGPILWTSPADEWERAQQEQADTELLAEWQADLTHDGEPEWIRVVGIQRRENVPDDWYFYEVRVQNEAGTYTYWTGEADSSHVGWNGIYLYQKDGKDYLMTWVPYGSTGIHSLSYSVFSLTPDGEELVLAANEMEYDTMPNRMDVDVSAIRAFEGEVNALLKDAFVLVDNTNNGIAQYSTAGNKLVNHCGGYADYVEQLQAQQNTEQ